MNYGLFFFLVFLFTFLFIFLGMRYGSSSSTPEPKGTGESGTSRKQMVEDIKMTKTSRVVDAVSILDELSETTSNYRQYCELIGTAQQEGGVIAPYSRREVAYYEIRCYRIENHGSGDVETLVAHEKSFDPFYFKDASCDTPIYVNIDSFGNQVMLINSTNHIEGPNSDFAKAVEGTSTSTSTSGSSSTYGVTAMVGEIVSGIVHGFGSARDAVVAGLLPSPQYAYAGFGTGALRSSMFGQEGWSRQFLLSESRGNLSRGVDKFARAGGSKMPSGSTAGQGARVSSGRSSHSGGSSQPKQSDNRAGGVHVTVNMPTGLGTFLGTNPYGGYSSVPHPMPRPIGHPYPTQTYHRVGSGDVIGDLITGMVLSSVLDSMAASATATQTTAQRQSTFRGYRLVEDVVPLGSPIYCIGEIYHHGTDVYMGKSLSTEYPTSFFATKPEIEVLAALGATS